MLRNGIQRRPFVVRRTCFHKLDFSQILYKHSGKLAVLGTQAESKYLRVRLTEILQFCSSENILIANKVQVLLS